VRSTKDGTTPKDKQRRPKRRSRRIGIGPAPRHLDKRRIAASVTKRDSAAACLQFGVRRHVATALETRLRKGPPSIGLFLFVPSGLDEALWTGSDETSGAWKIARRTWPTMLVAGEKRDRSENRICTRLKTTRRSKVSSDSSIPRRHQQRSDAFLVSSYYLRADAPRTLCSFVGKMDPNWRCRVTRWWGDRRPEIASMHLQTSSGRQVALVVMIRLVQSGAAMDVDADR
jgi:hypothetical protein